MKKPTPSREKVIIKPRPPQEAAQEGPVVGSPADTTSVPNVRLAEEMEEGPAEEEEEE